MSINHTRHSGLFQVDNLTVTVIGLGGLGSAVSGTVGRMGANLKLIDFDVVDDVNVATQFHPVENIGEKKTFSMAAEIEWQTRHTPITYDMRVDKDTDPHLIDGDIIISAVDSLGARLDIWEVVQKAGPLWYMDLRMAAEHFTMYNVHASQWEWYANVLKKHSRLEIAPVPCTEKATIYTASFCAGWVGLMIRKIVTDQPVPRMIDHNIIDMNVRMMNEHCFGTETARSKP